MRKNPDGSGTQKRFDKLSGRKPDGAETQKRFDKSTLLAAAVISAMLFLAGIGVGVKINEQKTSFIRGNIDSLDSDLGSFQLEFLMLDTIGANATCPILQSRINEANKDTYELGQRLVSYEDTSKFTNEEDLDILKRDYYRSLIRYWLLNKKIGEECHEERLDVLYFFQQECNDCDDQAIVLDYYKQQLKSDVLIFTLNADVRDPFIIALETFYNVTSFPSVIVDGEKLEGFQPRENLHEVFCLNHPELSVC